MSHLAIAEAFPPHRDGSAPFLGRESILRGPERPDLFRDELLCEIFASSAAFAPHAVAMMTRERKLTYAEVDAKAEALARGLVRKGLRPGDVAGLWVARGPELLIARSPSPRSAPPGCPSTPTRRSSVSRPAWRTPRPRAFSSRADSPQARRATAPGLTRPN